MPKTKQANIQKVLLDFYDKPIARVSVELFLSLTAVIFFAIFAIKPTLQTMSELVKEVEDKTALEKQLDQKIAALNTAQDQYQKFGDQFYLLEDAIPRRASLIDSLKIIERLSSETDLVVESISLSSVPDEIVSATSDDSVRKVLTFNVDVAGDYLDIRQFIEALINSRRMLIVDQISFSLDNDRFSEKLTARIQVNAPYYTINETE